MLRITDFITGNLSDSPADRAAAPFVFVLGLPVIVVGGAVYLSYKGVRYVGGKIADKIETKKYNKEMKQLESIELTSSALVREDNHFETSTVSAPITKIGPKKPKRLILERSESEDSNKKM